MGCKPGGFVEEAAPETLAAGPGRAPSTMTEILLHGVVYGLALSATLGGLIIFSVWWNPEIWLRSYPEPVRARFGREMSATARRQKKIIGVAGLGILIAVTASCLWHLGRRMGAAAGFFDAFLAAYAMFMVINLFDLLVVDWLMGVRLDPRWARLPGTEDMPSHQTYWMHFRGFLIGTGLVAVPAALGAALFSWAA